MPRPSLDADRRLVQQLRALPEHGPFTARYPKLNTKRGELAKKVDLATGKDIEDVGGSGATSTKVWPWRLVVTVASAISVCVSPKLLGPLMIYELLAITGNNATLGADLALLWSTDNTGFGTNLADTTKITGTHVYIPVSVADPGSTDPDAVTQHRILTQQGNTNSEMSALRLRYIVEQTGAIYLKARLRNASAGTMQAKGEVVIIEGESIDKLALVP